MATNLKENDVVQIFARGPVMRVIGQLPNGLIVLADPYLDPDARSRLYFGEGSLQKCDGDNNDIPRLAYRRVSVGTLRASDCHGKGGK